ncbi:hypothetical protein Gohar_024791, partial [Gossypium harknessii]|nr:hypothetical protein [Gossypium harknessii]
ADDRVLEGFIHNLVKPPITEIRGYLQECTITLEDVALQLDLPMDEPVIMGATIVPNKEDLCGALLGKVPNKFKGGQILMNWLEKNFQKLHSHATEVVKEQYARAFILQFIGGILMPNKS